jgi:CRISPR-associated exonuclease Cas4
VKIKKVQIGNFRSIKSLEFDFQDLTILIGENNTGKTNILKALDLFFSSTVRGIDEEYFRGKDVQCNINVTVTFGDLTSEEKSSKIRKYLIDDTLILQKTFSCNPETGKIESKFSGLIREPKDKFLKLSRFEEYKDKLRKIVTDNKLPNYFKTKKGTVTQASYKEGLKKYIEDNSREIEWNNPFFSDTHFLGWKEVAQGFLPHFFYVPAVKEASEEAEYASRNLFGRLIDAMLLEIPGKGAKLSELTKLLDKARRLLNRPAKGKLDKRPSQIRDFEQSLLGTLQESMPSASDIEIQVNVPQIRDLFQSGTQLIVDDGIKTTVQSKGHGLQRAVIFAIFRQYAKVLRQAGKQSRQGSKPFIFAVEEPELYLHPQSQLVMLDVLKSLSETGQVIVCTHSPFFIDMSRYNSLAIVSKPNLSEGTILFQCTEEIFSPKDKEHFKILNEFNPERNELFFARRVVLVEGITEKMAFPIIAKKMGKDLNAHGISIIECGSKYNIVFFMTILGKFRIPHVVVHDVDPVDERLSKDKKKEARRVFRLNKQISSALDSSLGTIEPIDPDFENLIGVTARQAGSLGKPYATFKKLQTLSEKDLPKKLKDIVESFF